MCDAEAVDSTTGLHDVLLTSAVRTVQGMSEARTEMAVAKSDVDHIKERLQLSKEDAVAKVCAT